jgi:hypothetical protein
VHPFCVPFRCVCDARPLHCQADTLDVDREAFRKNRAIVAVILKGQSLNEFALGPLVARGPWVTPEAEIPPRPPPCLIVMSYSSCSVSVSSNVLQPSSPAVRATLNGVATLPLRARQVIPVWKEVWQRCGRFTCRDAAWGRLIV